MDIRNCKRCGKIYNYDGFNICRNCRRDDEVDFKKVRDYIYEYPGANISEVNAETKVDVDKIITFLKEGRLEIAEGGNLILECEKCGVSIRSGRFCDKCTLELEREFGGVIDSAKSKNEDIPKKEAKFRYINRFKDKR